MPHARTSSCPCLHVPCPSCSIIYIDEKKFYITPQSFYVWAGKATGSVVVNARVMASRKLCINYLAAVNAKHGALLITMISGTKGTGYTPKKVYKASGQARLRACHAASRALIICARHRSLSLCDKRTSARPASRAALSLRASTAFCSATLTPNIGALLWPSPST